MRVGFIGLGNMGQPMANRLLDAGLPLMVHDIKAGAAAPLLARGATWTHSVGELAARCEVVCTCLPGPAEMQAVALGSRGIVESLSPGSIYIDHTTNSPETVRRVGAAIAARQGHMLDAPLDGGREGALEGQLTLFVGGDEAVLDRARPVLAPFSRSVVWVGDLGSGSIAKLVHNALAMSVDLLVTECLTVGVKAGVAMPRLVEAFREGCILGGNAMFTKRMPATLFSGDFAARFALDLACKDFRLTEELAVRHGVPTRLLDLCREELLEALRRGWGGQDRTAACQLQEERAGVRLRAGDGA